MNVSEEISAIFRHLRGEKNPLNYRKSQNKPLCIIQYLAAMSSILLITMVGALTNYDTGTYIDAIPHVLHGDIDQFRTPIYPLFLSLCQLLFGSNFLMGAIILQHIAYWVSIIYFDRLLSVLHTPRLARTILLAVYALHPGLTTFCNKVLTEAFSIIGLVMLMWVSHRLLSERRLRHSFYIFFWLTFLVFLRPSFIYLLPIYLIGWGYLMLKRCNKSFAMAFCASLATGTLVLGYVNSFEQRYGVRTITAISTVNLYHNLRMNGLLDTAAITPPEMKTDILTGINKYGMKTETPKHFMSEPINLINRYGLVPMQQMLDHSCQKNREEFIKGRIQNAYRADQSQVLKVTIAPLTLIYIAMPLYLHLIRWIIFFYLGVLGVQMARQRFVPPFSLLMVATALGLVVVVIIGASSEYGRLQTPIVPIVLLMMGQLCSMVHVSLKPAPERKMC